MLAGLRGTAHAGRALGRVTDATSRRGARPPSRTWATVAPGGAWARTCARGPVLGHRCGSIQQWAPFSRFQAAQARSLSLLSGMDGAGNEETMKYNSRMVEFLAPGGRRREEANAAEVFAMWEEMQEKDVPGNAMTYNFLLRACVLARAEFEVALDYFQEMLSQGFHPTRVTYNALLATCGLHGAVVEVFEVLDTMRNSGVAPDLLSHQYIVQACTRSRHWRRAVNHMEEMRESGITPNAEMLKSVANRAMDENVLPVAVRMLEDITRTPEPVPVHVVMRCLSQAASRCSIDVIRRALAIMDFSHHTADEGTLLMLMNVSVSMRDAQLGRDVYERASASGYTAPQFLASMLQLLAKTDEPDAAVALLEAAHTAGVRVPGPVLASVGRDLGATPRTAVKLGQRVMRSKGQIPATLAKTALWALSTAGRSRDVERLIADFQDLTGEGPDQEVCRGATHVYIHPRAADSRACEAMIRGLEQQGVEVCEKSLEHLGKAYILDRRTQRGIALLRTMREQGRTPTRDTYAFVIRRCIVRRKTEEARSLLEEAEEVHTGTWTNELRKQLLQEEQFEMWSGIFASLAAGRVPELPADLRTTDPPPRR